MREKIAIICSNPPQKRKVVDKTRGIEIAIPVPDWEAAADQILEAIREEIEKGLLTDKEIDVEARTRPRQTWLEYGRDMAQAQLQKILALLKG